MIVKEAHLFYEDDYSNKEYHLIIERNGHTYKVTSKFGPRYGTLTHVDLTRGWTNYTTAANVFDKKEKEKRRKGYKDLETPRQRLIKYLKLHSLIFILDYQWEAIAKAVEEYMEEES